MARDITLVIVLPVLWLTSCGMALSVLPPLDFPPGDMQTLTIVNDTRRALVVFDCDDPTCVRGINDQEITVGSRDYRNADSYTPEVTVRMSSAVRCPGMTEPAPTVHFYNPS